MENKGFTLIELLAVIVILAIIGLIATPIVLDIINDVKEEANKRSIDNIVHAANIYYTEAYLKDSTISNKINIEDIKEELKGTIPESGFIYFDDNGNVSFSLKFQDKIYEKSFEGDIKTEETNQINYLKLEVAGNDSEALFLENPYNIKKKDIEKIITVPTNKVPSDAIGHWDVTHNQENKEEMKRKVMAWYNDSDSNGLYEVYIGQTGGVKANPELNKIFNYLINVKEIDVTYLNTEYVTSMKILFQRCEKLETIKGLENFDTSNVTDMTGMFSNCFELQSVNLSSFNTQNVTNMQGMFQNCISLKEIDVSSFDTSNVESMRLMFGGTKVNGVTMYMQLERVMGLENFDTSNVENMYSMFSCCNSLSSLDLRKWNTSKVTDMSYMFTGTINLKPIYIGENWKTASNVTSMFGGNAKTTSVEEMCGPNSTHSWCLLD